SMLQDALAGTRCLIVLDNLDSLDQITALDVVGPGSALLVTTTDRAALPHTTRICEVEGFGPGGSEEVLRRYAGSAPPLPEAATRIAAACGGLALGLAICGALVEEGCSWEEAAVLLDRPVMPALEKPFRGYAHTSLTAAFE